MGWVTEPSFCIKCHRAIEGLFDLVRLICASDSIGVILYPLFFSKPKVELEVIFFCKCQVHTTVYVVHGIVT